MFMISLSVTLNYDISCIFCRVVCSLPNFIGCAICASATNWKRTPHKGYVLKLMPEVRLGVLTAEQSNTTRAGKTAHTQNKKTVKQKSQLWAILNGAQQCYTHHFVWQYFSASINLNLLWFVKYKNFILICCHAVWVCRTIRLHWIVSAEKRDEVEPSTPSASIFNDGNVSFTRKMGKYDITQKHVRMKQRELRWKSLRETQKKLENK